MSSRDISLPGNQTAQAAIPNVIGKLPLELRLDSKERQITDSVIHDTVTVTKTVYKRVPKLKRTTDTVYLQMLKPEPMQADSVNNKISGDREEHTQDSVQSPKPSTIRLIVDDKIVYESKNDIHSAEESQ